MKLAWLVFVPAIAVLALFAVRTSPTLAGPSCADQCTAISADQVLPGSAASTTTLYSGASIYTQVSGQYCSDKSGGQVFVNTGSDTTGLTCPAAGASMPAMSMSSATAAATTAASSTPAATKPAGTATAAPAGSAAAATATATATAGAH